jgi:hypothetical protein
MNLLPGIAYSNVNHAGTSLRQVINQLLSHSLPSSPNCKNIIVNEITADICMTGDEDKVLPVISELLSSVVSNARNGNIHITAEQFRDGVILEIQERNTYNGYALAYRVQSIEPQAAMLGGYITMKGKQQLVTTISFGFPNQVNAPSYDC